MALHDRDSIRDQFEDCVFVDQDLTRPVAKYRFPPEGTLPRDADLPLRHIPTPVLDGRREEF